MKRNIFLSVVLLIAVSAFNTTFAHCDSVEGPVVKAAQKTLETGNINYVLVWVRAEDEQEIKAMFDSVNKVRALSPEAKELADMYFFETVVRVHRMGEGVGYTGLKPVGYQPEEGIEAADIAIAENSLEPIYAHLDEEQNPKVKEYFAELQSKKDYDVNDLKAGREYVEAYVHFIHYVESLFNGEEVQDSHSEHKH
jgi:phosphotransacetylase